jgi:O-antigen/teichoic acid export membrane protein
MIRSITQTFLVRAINAFLMLFLVLLCTNTLKISDYGSIGLIVLDISFIMLLNDLVGGSAMVFFSSRIEPFRLVVIGYLWALVTAFIAVIAGFFLSLFPNLYAIVVPDTFGPHIIALALINSFSTIHINLLVGKEKISQYNTTFLVQITSLVVLVSLLVFVVDLRSVGMYVYALYGSYTLTWLVGLFFTRHFIKTGSIRNIVSGIKEVSKYRIFTQMGNLIQLGNRRFSFYIIKGVHGASPLGIFNAAIQLTEGLRIIGHSISLIQFSRISGTRDLNYSRELTIRMVKLTLLVTLFFLIVMMAVPADIYAWIFGEEYRFIHTLVFCLAPGILALNTSMMLSSFFSGIGSPKYNMISSGIGFIFTLAAIYPAVLYWTYIGAGLTASGAYIFATVYQLIIFVKLTGAKRHEFVIKKADFILFFQFIKAEFSKRPKG